MAHHPNTNLLIPSTAFGSGATNSVIFQSPAWALGAIFFQDATAVSGTSPTLDSKIQAVVSGDFIDTVDFIDWPLAAFTQVTAAILQLLEIYPGVTPAVGVSVSTVMPREWRFVNTVGGTSTPIVTASISVHWIR